MNLLIIDGLECYEENGTAYLKLETVARGLGLVQEKDDKTYIRWDRICGYLEEFNFRPQVGENHNLTENKICTFSPLVGKIHDLPFFTEWAKTAFIPENIFYRLAMKAKNDVAEAFQAKIADEIIPQIRKTGSYNARSVMSYPDYELEREKLEVQRAKAMLENLDRVNTLSAKYKDVVYTIAMNKLAGSEVLPLPKQERRTYSAKEVGERFNVSANKIGRIANAHNLKVPEYGEYYRSKSEYSNREVDTWRYYDSVFPVIKEILENE